MSDEHLKAVAEQIKTRFSTFETLARDNPWEGELFDAYVALRDAIKQPLPSEDATAVLKSFEHDFRVRLEHAYNLALIKYEYDIVEKLSGEIDWPTFLSLPEFLYIPDFLRLALIEYRHAGLTPSNEGQSIVFVGGGSFPITPISFVLLYSAHTQGKLEAIADLLDGRLEPAGQRQLQQLLKEVYSNGICNNLFIKVLDRDPDAIPAAKRFLSGLNLSEQITYTETDIADYIPGANLRAIIFAASVSGKNILIPVMLSRLQGQHSIRLVFRTVPDDSLRSLLYEPLPPKLMEDLSEQFPGFKALQRTEPDAAGLITTSTVSAEYTSAPS